MSGVIETIERAQLRRVPKFQAGDRLRVHFQVVEGSRKRTQVFEGVVIKRQGSGARETFTVRKQSFGVGVERTFPVHSPKIEQIEVAARGDDELEGVMPPPETDAIVDAPEPEAPEAAEEQAPEAEATAPEAAGAEPTEADAPEAEAEEPAAESAAEAEADEAPAAEADAESGDKSDS